MWNNIINIIVVSIRIKNGIITDNVFVGFRSFSNIFDDFKKKHLIDVDSGNGFNTA